MEVAALLYRPTSGGVTYPWMISLPNGRVCGTMISSLCSFLILWDAPAIRRRISRSSGNYARRATLGVLIIRNYAIPNLSVEIVGCHLVPDSFRLKAFQSQQHQAGRCVVPVPS